MAPITTNHKKDKVKQQLTIKLRKDNSSKTVQQQRDTVFIAGSSSSSISDCIILFLKCVVSSCLVTLLVLCCTSYDEVVYMTQEMKRSVWSPFSTLFHDNSTLNQVIQGHVDESRQEEDAFVYTVQIPSQCRSIVSRNDSTSIGCKNIISKEMKKAFDRDGVVAIRGLLSKEEIESLDAASMELMGIIIPPLEEHHERDNSDHYLNTYRTVPKDHMGGQSSGRQFISTLHHVIFEPGVEAFQNVALRSLVPQVVSELLDMNQINQGDNSSNLRLVRDIFLAKDQDPYICGWHVDDIGFWPTTFDSKGINAWIAIDSIPKSTGGGFALAVGSHVADWRWEAYRLTGSTATLPEEGYKNAEDMFEKRGVGTCNIRNVSPNLHEKMEASKRIYDIQKGDVIFHTRWLFHRTVPVHRNFARELDKNRSKVVLRRYSLRYSPGDAILVKGYGTELSKLYDESHGGKTLNDISMVDGPWYPQCWPNVLDEEEVENLNQIKEKMDSVQHEKKQRMKEMRPFLQEIGRKQRRAVLENAMKMSGNQGDGATKWHHTWNTGGSTARTDDKLEL